LTLALGKQHIIVEDTAVRHAVILAGGGGTRLWPLSHRQLPKQLLPFGAGGKTLLAAAAQRACAATGTSAPALVVTGAGFLQATKLALPNARFIAEPCARNTAAAIGLAAVILHQQDPDAIMIATPADQHVSNEVEFIARLQRAAEVVEQRDVICTLGIVPTRPETGFGYLQITDRLSTINQPSMTALEVERFVEKPSQQIAKEYVAGGKHLWNAGIFVVRAARLIADIKRFLPELSAGLAAIGDAHQRGPEAFESALAEIFPTLPSISIDHGVMEKTTGVVTIAADVGWDDIGSWASIPSVLGKDANGNSCAGNVLVIDGSDNVVVSERGVITVLGVSNIAVIRRGDAVLVIPLDRAQDVKQVVEQLQARGLNKYL
jgi:mannose-1-phosphate guanylyltransferase